MGHYLKEEVGKKRHFKMKIIISSCRQWEQYNRANFEEVGNKGNCRDNDFEEAGKGQNRAQGE